MTAHVQPVIHRLVADVGGTNTRVGIVASDGTVAHLARLRNDQHAGLAQALKDYLAGLSSVLGTPPVDAAIAVAAPITGTEVRLTNRRDWVFSSESLAQGLGIGQVHLINDFTAVALCLPWLGEDELQPLGGVARRADRGSSPATPTVVLGPGTGLGVSALIPHDAGYVAIEGEGGHATAAAFTEQEAELIAWIREREGHVSWETLLCGAGLVRLHGAVATLGGHVGGANVEDAAEVVARADAGDRVAERSLQTFFAMLGGFAGDLALSFGAYSGVYLAGGILPRLRPRLIASDFRKRFESKGHYSQLLAPIPTALITAPEPALLGLAAFCPSQVAGAC